MTARGAVDRPERLAAVRATDLLDAAAEASFDRLTAMARRMTGAPLAFLTVVDDQRSYWLSRQGLVEDGPVQNTVEESFCQYVLGGDALVLPDVTTDDRTRANPSIEGMGVRAWAGFPVHTPDGEVLGSFCVVDTDVHQWTAADVELLEDLAAIASREVALRTATAQAEQARAVAHNEAERAALLARIGDLLSTGLEPADVWEAIATLAVPALGDFAYVCTVERDGSLVPVAARHRDPRELRPLEHWLHAAGRRLGEAVGPGHVAATGVVEQVDLPSAEGLTSAQRDAVERLAVCSAIIAPLTSRREVVAVLTVARVVGSDPYSPVDRELVCAVADRAGLVVENALAYARERSFSETMQRALLPSALPHLDGLQLAARYRPAGDVQLVGGDWYDAFRDPSGTASVVIGDVAGHDIDAATTMGQLRTLLRVAGREGGASAADVLTAVDASSDTLGHPVFATALLAQIEPAADGQAHSRLLRWTSAGHPPPLLLLADGDVRVLDDPVDLPLGVDPTRARSDHRATLPAGATLLMYTDGLLERRATGGGRDADEGMARLAGVLADSSGLSLEELCDHVMATLVPAAGADDDVAIIAIRGEAATGLPGTTTEP